MISWDGSSGVSASELFTVRLPSGLMKFSKQGQWKWADSCRSIEHPCYSATLGKTGSAYLFAAPVSTDRKNQSNQAPQDFKKLCKDVYSLSSNLAASLPKQSKPNGLQFKKTLTGYPYCVWNQANTSNYFWKVGNSVVSMAFTSASVSEVENLVQGVQIRENH